MMLPTGLAWVCICLPYSMRFYCERHEKDFYVSVVPGRVICYSESEVERHYFGDFPHSEFWEYCCVCETARWSGPPTKPLVSHTCPRCKSAVGVRYLCDGCSVLTIDAVDVATDRRHTLIAGQPPTRRRESGPTESSCPGCLNPPKLNLHLHNCSRREASFWSARKHCPFCQEPIEPPPPFPVLAQNFLAGIASKDKITAACDILGIENNVLVPSPDGEFIVIFNGARKARTILLPKRTSFQRPEDGHVYSDFYDWDQATVGEVKILSPAVVKKTRGGWLLVERGRLEVVSPPAPDAQHAPLRAPRRAADYLADDKKKPILAFDPARKLFVQSRDGNGPFVLVKDVDGSLVVLPRVTHFSGKAGFEKHFSLFYQQCYGCSELVAGDVWIALPAVVEKVRSGWKLTKKGLLEVRPAEAAKPPFTVSAIDTKSQPALPLEAKSEISASASENASVVKPSLDYTENLPSKVATPGTLFAKRKWLVTGGVVAVVAIIVGLVSLNRWPTTSEPRPQPTKPPAAPENMVYVPGGKFMMGDTRGDDYEKPVHEVTLGPFNIDKYEVTCQQYDAFVKATGHRVPRGWIGGTYPQEAARKPVTDVDWDDANAYARWAGKRLPTEEEWEFAARGASGWRYPWGNSWRSKAANADGTTAGRLVHVGEHVNGASSFGLFDMVGNAWEWTASSLQAYPGGQLPSRLSGEFKVIRGGSWRENQNQATTTYRGYLPANGGTDYSATGFRCAKDISVSN